MKEQTREDPYIVAAAERQMRAWVHNEESSQRTADRVDRPREVRLGPYLALSREAGAGGSEIAQRLGQQLGWDVLDKNIVDYIAQRVHASKELLELLDETERNWAYDLMSSWIDREMIGRDKYLHHMLRVILNAARAGRVILVGRGASFLLPRAGGLAVRVIAGEDFRLQRVMRLRDLDAAAARDCIHGLDRGRADFVSSHFHKDVADPHAYDLVLNVGRLGIDPAVEVIVDAMKRAAVL